MFMPIQFEGVQSIMASIRAKALDTINNESPAPMPMHTAQGSLKLNFRAPKASQEKNGSGMRQRVSTPQHIPSWHIIPSSWCEGQVVPCHPGSAAAREIIHIDRHPTNYPEALGLKVRISCPPRFCVHCALGYYLVAVGQKPFDYSGTMVQDTHFKREPRKSNCKTSKMNSAWQ